MVVKKIENLCANAADEFAVSRDGSGVLVVYLLLVILMLLILLVLLLVLLQQLPGFAVMLVECADSLAFSSGIKADGFASF